MLNSSFNREFNYTKKQVPVGEVNKLLSDKKKEAYKQATKYDINKKDHVKALNIHNLGTTPRFLPLFTRKVANDKVIENAPEQAQDLDYTKTSVSPKKQ